MRGHRRKNWERDGKTGFRIAKKLGSYDQREGQLAQKPYKVKKREGLQRTAHTWPLTPLPSVPKASTEGNLLSLPESAGKPNPYDYLLFLVCV